MELNTKRAVGVGFGVMLLRGSQVLLGRRHDDPEKASSLLEGEGTWTMPGGKLKFGESFEEGAIRETKEETGLDLAEDDLRVISVSNDVVSTAHFVTIGLLCTTHQGNPQVLEPDEITEWMWFELDDLPDNLFFPSKKIVESYKAREFYKKAVEA